MANRRPESGNGRLGIAEMLPIVRRELRAGSRRRVTFRLRFGAALSGAALLVLATLLLPEFSTRHGQALFWISSTTAALVCAFSGLALTIDCISREKREGTLGLLFLTRLGGHDIVLGKLAAALLSGGSIAFALLPFLAISLCLGGVNASQFWAMSGALLLLLLYSLTVGLFLSALFQRESVAAVLFIVVMLAPLLLHSARFARPGALSEKSLLLHPFIPAMAVLDSGGAVAATPLVKPGLARAAVIAQGSAVVVMLALASMILPRMVKNRAERKAIAFNRPFVTRLRTFRRRGALEITPTLWLYARQNRPLSLLWFCLGLWLAIHWLGILPAEAEVIYAFSLAILPKFFVAWRASGLMGEERHNGGLELLLTTPLATREILAGKARAIQRQFAPALIFALVVHWFAGTRWWAADGLIPLQTTLLFAVMIGTLVDAYTVEWIGLWHGLRSRDRGRALIRTVLVGILLPWAPFVVVAGLTGVILQPKWMRDLPSVLIPGYISAIICSIAVGLWSMGRLHETLRAEWTPSRRLPKPAI